MNTPDTQQPAIDDDRWRDYRDSVIAEVTATLDRLKPVAEAMDPLDAHFTGTFDIDAGRGHHKVSIHVGPIPIFIEDDDEDWGER